MRGRLGRAGQVGEGGLVVIGTVQTVVVCVAAVLTVEPCPSGSAPATVQAYVLDVSQQPTMEALNAPFDFDYAAGIWGIGFTFVVGLFLVARGVGTALGIIKH